MVAMLVYSCFVSKYQLFFNFSTKIASNKVLTKVFVKSKFIEIDVGTIICVEATKKTKKSYSDVLNVFNFDVPSRMNFEIIVLPQIQKLL